MIKEKLTEGVKDLISYLAESGIDTESEKIRNLMKRKQMQTNLQEYIEKGISGEDRQGIFCIERIRKNFMARIVDRTDLFLYGSGDKRSQGADKKDYL